MPDLTGQSIGRYHIVAPLGEGGMAVVYKAFDTRLECDVAIKFIRKENVLPNQLEHMTARFEREAKRMAKFLHPNIIKVIDYGEYEGSPYLVMPYLPGGTLKDLLKNRHGKPFSYLDAVRILAPVARALEYAHEQDTIHRDVKPANILLTDEGLPMLIDFGVAKILDLDEGQTLTGTGVGVGTPKYMAPEQWMNQISPQTDVYALGVVLYEFVTGRVPYIADTPLAVMLKQNTEPMPPPHQYAPNLPEEVERVIYKALAKEPQARYVNMGAFAAAMEKLATLPLNVSLRASEREETFDYASTPLPSEPSQKSASSVPSAEKSASLAVSAPSTSSDKSASSVLSTSSDKSAIPISFLIGAIALVIVIIVIGGLSWSLNRMAQSSHEFSTQTAESYAQVSLIAMDRQTPSFSLQEEGQNESGVTKTSPSIASQTPFDTPLPVASRIPSDTPLPATLTPSPVAPRISEKDGMEEIFIPAGEFLMGSVDSDIESFTSEKPPHKVYLDAYWMDKTEVTNAMYQKCVRSGSCQNPSSTKSYTRNSYYGNSKYANFPVVYVDWKQARVYCIWAGGRLPTEAEWEKAARGVDGRKYPWGNAEPNDKLLNFDMEMNNDTTAVGSYPQGASPYGIMDLAGNVFEWVSDWYDEYYYENSLQKNPQGPDSGDVRAGRGGSWNYGRAFVRTASRYGNAPDKHNNYLGFRCVRLP